MRVNQGYCPDCHPSGNTLCDQAGQARSCDIGFSLACLCSFQE
jgi:hypothetical protein